jgi:hypothetical protein
VFESIDYFLTHLFLAQMALKEVKQVSYFRLFATSPPKKIITPRGAN